MFSGIYKTQPIIVQKTGGRIATASDGYYGHHEYVLMLFMVTMIIIGVCCLMMVIGMCCGWFAAKFPRSNNKEKKGFQYNRVRNNRSDVDVHEEV